MLRPSLFAVTTCLSILFIATGATQASSPTAQNIINRIIARVNENCEWDEKTRDVFIAGDPSTQVTGVAVCLMTTQKVLEEAAAADCNLVITHEPTFYSGSDDGAGLEEDPVLKAKREFIKQQGLVIWRFHDHAHKHTPDLLVEGMIDGLGLRKQLVSKSPPLFLVKETSVKDFASLLKKRLGANSIDIVGDPDMRLRKVGLAVGAPFSLTQMKLLQRDDVEVLIAGETREWETVPYVRDAVTQGRHKAMILLGHVNSEEAGMRHVYEWLKPELKDVPSKYIPTEDPFVDVVSE